MRSALRDHAKFLTRLDIRDETDLVAARRCTRELAARQGLSAAESEALATAVTEIARNIVVHAGHGEMRFGVVDHPSRRGMVVIAHDTGAGIPCVADAMQDGYSTRGSLGYGLPGARRLVDEFEIESTVSTGTTVTLCKWALAAAR